MPMREVIKRVRNKIKVIELGTGETEGNRICYQLDVVSQKSVPMGQDVRALALDG